MEPLSELRGWSHEEVCTQISDKLQWGLMYKKYLYII